MSHLAAEISFKDVNVTTIVLGTLAIVVTSLRLFDRARLRKLWWDDAWALIASIFMIIFMVAVLLHIRTSDSLTRGAKIGVYYMCAQFFYAVAWSARISILFTVIRISPNGPTRTVLSFVAVAFFVTWTILFAQVWWVCEREPGWKDAVIPQCALGENVAIAQVITDVICDTILITSPIRLIKGVRLSRARKIQLISVFSTTSVTTAVSLYHAFAVLRVGGFYEAFAAVIQTSISLIIANLTVIVALVMRMKHEETETNREPLFIHSVGLRNRHKKADPLHTLTTFEGTLTAVGIKTTSETDAAIDGTTSTGSFKKPAFFGDDERFDNSVGVSGPETYELGNLTRAEHSQTLVGK